MNTMLRTAGIATLATFAAMSIARAQTGDLAKGRALVAQVCAQCHAVRAEEARSPNPEAPTFQSIADISGMTALALSVALKTPHRTMPNLVLAGDERDNVIAYILSLRSRK